MKSSSLLVTLKNNSITWKKKYGVRLVFNDKYADYNNFYSLYLVKEELANSYVIDADNYLFKNMFRNDLTRSTYFSVYREDCTNEWFLVYGDDYKVQDITVDSKAGRILSGVSFWDAPTAEKIVSFIDKGLCKWWICWSLLGQYG